MSRVRRVIAGATLLPALVVGSLCASRIASADPVPGGTPRPAVSCSKNVAVADFSYTPDQVKAVQGAVICWSFSGPSNHSVTDSTGMGLFDSGQLGPGGSFSHAFDSAGTYPYHCTVHAAMKGSVEIPVNITPRTGGLHRTFTVAWSTVQPAPNVVFDVQLRSPGRHWRSWEKGVTAVSGDFLPRFLGRYSFRARMRDATTGKHTGYSPVETIRVK